MKIALYTEHTWAFSPQLLQTASRTKRNGFLLQNVSILFIAGWSSPVARQAHNLKVTGSNPVPAPILKVDPRSGSAFLMLVHQELNHTGSTEERSDDTGGRRTTKQSCPCTHFKIL